MSNLFNNKILAITGGTGSFGNALLKKIIKNKIKFSEIRIISRDEKKQFDMREKFNLHNIKFIISDVRDKSSMKLALKGCDYVFHAAALKQVPSCEFYPLEAVKTNIIGTQNVIDSCLENKIKKLICLSTDKAVYPINAMGCTKSLMEKVALSSSRNYSSTIINVTRYGNVMASRGSVIPTFIDQLTSGRDITITDPNMTRFLMSLDEALELVIYGFKQNVNGSIFIKKSPSAKIITLYEALKDIFQIKGNKLKIIGTRHGEKKHEVLISREERVLSKEYKNYFEVKPDLRNLRYESYFKKGTPLKKKLIEYSSDKVKILNKKELINKLLKIDYIKSRL